MNNLNHIPPGMTHEQAARVLMVRNLNYPVKLERLKVPAFPPIIELWRSRGFLVQVMVKENGAQRISINRTSIDCDTGRWTGGITWDELRQIKIELGLADKFAVEIYPAEKDVVDVSNMRHLWILDEPLDFAWRKP